MKFLICFLNKCPIKVVYFLIRQKKSDHMVIYIIELNIE